MDHFASLQLGHYRFNVELSVAQLLSLSTLHTIFTVRRFFSLKEEKRKSLTDCILRDIVVIAADSYYHFISCFFHFGRLVPFNCSKTVLLEVSNIRANK